MYLGYSDVILAQMLAEKPCLCNVYQFVLWGRCAVQCFGVCLVRLFVCL